MDAAPPLHLVGLWGWLASQESRDRPRECGGGAPRLFSWRPGCVLVFLFPGQCLRPCPEALALPACCPFPSLPPPAPQEQLPVPTFPCLGRSRPRLTWLSSTGLLWLVASPGRVVPSVPRRGNWLRRVAREGPGEVGTWQESVLPGWLWLWVLAVVIDMF